MRGIRSLVVALACGMCGYAQTSVVLDGKEGSYVIPAVSPWTTLRDVRIEFRLHDITIPKDTPATLFATGRIDVKVQPDGRLRIYNFEDTGYEGDSVYLSLGGCTDVTVRVQRDVTAKQMTAEMWHTQGSKNYQMGIKRYTKMGTRSWAQQRTFGTAASRVNVAFLHMSSALVPLESPAPSEHHPADLIRWNFEESLTDSTAEVAISMKGGATYAATPVYAPIAAPGISGLPLRLLESVVRAGETVQLNGDKSSTFAADPKLKYLWQQLSGPTKLIWSSRTTANPTVEGLVFGEYKVQLIITDSKGAKDSKELVFGAVATDDKGVAVHADPNIEFVFGPMIRYGASPWPWHDENHRELSETYGKAVMSGTGSWEADWVTPLTGTVSTTRGNQVITGHGTTFQSDFCGGPGNTSPVGSYPAIAVRNGVQKYAALVSSCISDTELRIAGGEENYLPTWTNASYSKTLNGAWWGGAANGSGGQNNANYYDNVMAHYALYYRTGLTKYREYARTLADRWYDSPFFLRAGSPPRVWSLTGIMWRAYEGGLDAWWADELHPHLDGLRSSVTSGDIGDPREDAYKIVFLAIASKLTKDTARAANYRQSVTKAATDIWIPAQRPEGMWVTRSYYYASWNGYPGSVTVTKGSNIVKGSGTAWSSSWPWKSYYFWIADDSFNGDPVTYRATWNSATQVTLDRPYEGESATGKRWQLSNLCGPGVQPFMMGVVASTWSYGHQATGHTGMRQLVTSTAKWIVTQGMQTSTKGLYYGRLYPNCEPISDGKPHCSYDPSSTSSVISGRFLSGEVLGALSMAYIASGDPELRAKGDRLFAANFGKYGGPESDTIYAAELEQGTNGAKPKNFGFFHGFGRAATWPAARIGGRAASKVKMVDVGVRAGDVPGATQIRVKITAPTRAGEEHTCQAAGSCRIPVDITRGSQVVAVLEYRNASGKVLSSSEPFVIH